MTSDKATHREATEDAVRATGNQERGFALSASEEREVDEKLPPSVQVLHETIRVQGELEMSRSVAALAWSSLAAGLTMGFSMLVPALLHAQLGDVAGAGLIEKFGYTVGFLVVILSRQQLFTENTMTAVLPAMSQPGWRSLRRLLRLWGIVLVGNLAGGAVFAYAVGNLPLLDAPTHAAIVAAGQDLMHNLPLPMFSKAIVSGWLIATMVWLVAASEGAKVFVILLMTYLVALGGFAHSIVGSIEGLFLVFDGRLSLATFTMAFLLPTLAGNIVGGSLIFALISHAQVRSDNA